jgi:uncharacterized protein YqgV (UPF0045/DUF77 family)
MFVSAQISLYPLRQARLSPVINDAISIFRTRGLEVSSGVMSSVVSGDDEPLFGAIKDVFRKSAEQSDVVMVVTLSNACPVSR